MVVRRLGTVERDTDRVESGLRQSLHGLGQTAIGIEVDGAPISLLANEADALFHHFSLQQRFSFTSLAKAGNGPGRTFQMRYRHPGNLTVCGDKGDAILG